MNKDDFTIHNFLKENLLKTREDLGRSLIDLLAPLEHHIAPGGYHLGDFGALYPPKTAFMEGWSRTLWGIASYTAGFGAYPGIDKVLSIMKDGVNPSSPAYWGECKDRDQLLVEMAAIALSLIIARNVFWDSLDGEQQGQLYAWLSSIEQRELPPSNWHFFRILVCTAFRELGLPVNERAERESFDIVESCYRGEGWYEDGKGGNYDLYNPMGFHFYTLLYAKLAGKRDPERSALYIERARLFACKFAAWFRGDGSIVPYGRSLTYRFAAVSLFSACAFADIEALPWGIMKGIVLRGLRRWFSLPILDSGGILSVGYGYPNLVMADAYNSPGSPYWGLKAYLVLALGADHPFWRAEEEPLPDVPLGKAEIVAERIPNFIITRTQEDVQLLTAGQYPGFDMNHPAQKYCKFAYSARFAFCVSHGSYGIGNTGCDSMLMLSEGDGYWRERRNISARVSGLNWTMSVWNPWPDVQITTMLVSLGAWHVRIHRIKSERPLMTVEGGFSIPRYDKYGGGMLNASPEEHEAIAAFPWGASRIAAVEPDSRRAASLVIPAPNLNILYPHAVIPVLEGSVEQGFSLLASAVRAGDVEPVMSEAVPQVELRTYLGV
ncbi:MAG: DUF2264 domain-containing protein [Treponema sp.]|nr:DUF2264 domain-containing protein [Treponema sp.]